MERTYSLQEVADLVLPPEWKDSVRWLSRRLNRGELRGYRLSRNVWRMTAEDVEFLVAKHRNAVTTPASAFVPEAAPVADGQVVSLIDGLSERSRRRVRGRAS